jgi:dUTP pyrophosphatase
MRRAACFERVTRSEFIKSAPSSAYDRIRLPQRATSGAAGYDFTAPVDISIEPGEAATVPTGIRVRLEEDVALLLLPRSGLGFAYRMQLANTMGLIDSDYYGAANQGHIFARIVNGGDQRLVIHAGERFCQGILVPYLLTYDDEPSGNREGGIGSTGL